MPFCTDVAQSADKHIVAVAELAGFGLVASVLLGANYFVFCSVHGVYVWLVGEAVFDFSVHVFLGEPLLRHRFH